MWVAFSFLTLVSLTRVLDEFEQLPAHLMQELHLFSMYDLIGVKKGQLCTIAKALIQSAVAHIDTCEVCPTIHHHTSALTGMHILVHDDAHT